MKNSDIMRLEFAIFAEYEQTMYILMAMSMCRRPSFNYKDFFKLLMKRENLKKILDIIDDHREDWVKTIDKENVIWQSVCRLKRR